MGLRVIVSGGGIAGLALAYWLDRIGASTLVIERAPCFQALGHYISLKGNGVEMARRMGIFDACQASAAPIDQTCMYTSTGRFLRSERTAALARTLSGYILFRRSDLQAALFDLARERADIRFGVEIVEARLDSDGVHVTLSDGRTEVADVLVGSDGIHSRVRDLVFGHGFERPLGGHYIAITQTFRHRLTLATRAYLGVDTMVNLFPVSDDSVSAVVYLNEGAGRPPRHDALAMRDYLLATFVGFPDEVRRVFENVGADDYVFADTIAQIAMPRITRGRCALIGDAAHCPTFLSGMGSSLALQDAHILAGCLARSTGDIAAALEQYENVVTPVARRYRESARRAHRLLLGGGRFHARLRDQIVRLIPERLLERSIRRFIDAERPLADVPALPNTG